MTCRLDNLALIAMFVASACFVDPPPTASDDDDDVTTTAATTGSNTTGPITTTITATAGPTSITNTSGVDSDSTSSGTSFPTSPDTITDASSDDTGNSSSDGSSSDGSSTGMSVLNVEDLIEGDLVITEVMGNPNCVGDNCEWFEILNTTDLPIQLQGLGIGTLDAIEDKIPATFVTAMAILDPGALGVLALDQGWPYAGEPLATYGNDGRLSNSSLNQIAVFGTHRNIIDATTTYLPNGSPDQGRSFSLRPEAWNAASNDVHASWCWSNTVLVAVGADDWGTPGTADVSCVSD